MIHKSFGKVDPYKHPYKINQSKQSFNQIISPAYSHRTSLTLSNLQKSTADETIPEEELNNTTLNVLAKHGDKDVSDFNQKDLREENLFQNDLNADIDLESEEPIPPTDMKLISSQPEISKVTKDNLFPIAEENSSLQHQISNLSDKINQNQINSLQKSSQQAMIENKFQTTQASNNQVPVNSSSQLINAHPQLNANQQIQYQIQQQNSQILEQQLKSRHQILGNQESQLREQIKLSQIAQQKKNQLENEQINFLQQQQQALLQKQQQHFMIKQQEEEIQLQQQLQQQQILQQQQKEKKLIEEQKKLEEFKKTQLLKQQLQMQLEMIEEQEKAEIMRQKQIQQQQQQQQLLQQQLQQQQILKKQQEEMLLKQQQEMLMKQQEEMQKQMNIQKKKELYQKQMQEQMLAKKLQQEMDFEQRKQLQALKQQQQQQYQQQQPGIHSLINEDIEDDDDEDDDDEEEEDYLIEQQLRQQLKQLKQIEQKQLLKKQGKKFLGVGNQYSKGGLKNLKQKSMKDEKIKQLEEQNFILQQQLMNYKQNRGFAEVDYSDLEQQQEKRKQEQLKELKKQQLKKKLDEKIQRELEELQKKQEELLLKKRQIDELQILEDDEINEEDFIFQKPKSNIQQCMNPKIQQKQEEKYQSSQFNMLEQFTPNNNSDFEALQQQQQSQQQQNQQQQEQQQLKQQMNPLSQQNSCLDFNKATPSQLQVQQQKEQNDLYIQQLQFQEQLYQQQLQQQQLQQQQQQQPQQQEQQQQQEEEEQKEIPYQQDQLEEIFQSQSIPEQEESQQYLQNFNPTSLNLFESEEQNIPEQPQQQELQQQEPQQQQKRTMKQKRSLLKSIKVELPTRCQFALINDNTFGYVDFKSQIRGIIQKFAEDLYINTVMQKYEKKQPENLQRKQFDSQRFQNFVDTFKKIQTLDQFKSILMNHNIYEQKDLVSILNRQFNSMEMQKQYNQITVLSMVLQKFLKTEDLQIDLKELTQNTNSLFKFNKDIQMLNNHNYITRLSLMRYLVMRGSLTIFQSDRMKHTLSYNLFGLNLLHSNLNHLYNIFQPNNIL